MKAKNFDVKNTLWKNSIPKPVFEEHPEYAAFYERTWEIARDHVLPLEGMPQTPYMDEAFLLSDIWIWDTCFMMFYCKYAADVFPGIETLNNFYMPLHDGAPLPKVLMHNPPEWTGYKDGEMAQVRIHIPDNPPLFAWAEYSYALMTGDEAHLRELLLEKQYLQKHFEFFESFTEAGWGTKYTRAPTCLVKHPDGYFWEGGRSGMDNTPRGRTGRRAEVERPNNPEMLWVDAIAQQALSADFIARIARRLGETETAEKWQKVYEEISRKVNELYWDEEDGVYYDIHCTTHAKMKCLTPASFWPMLAGIPTAEQAERMCKVLTDPNLLGGQVPWTTVARNDPDFEPEYGHYWRGAMWLPTAYMGIKALERYGKFELANDCARRIVDHMYITWRDYEPHTVWECYSPTKHEPAKHGETRVRPDFCGWSALGPIALFLENVIGITGADAFHNTLSWNLPANIKGAIGVENYSFGDVVCSVILKDGVIRTESTAPFTLIVNGRSFAVPAGSAEFGI